MKNCIDRILAFRTKQDDTKWNMMKQDGTQWNKRRNDDGFVLFKDQNGTY